MVRDRFWISQRDYSRFAQVQMGIFFSSE